MCGIIGILGSKIPEKSVVEKARDSMIHRGPDDCGIYYNPQEGVALGHRRLSIIDLSSAGHQPMLSNDGRYAVVFNGEIYNYLEIKKELKNSYDFKTQSDTEVLIAAYSRWGRGCLEKISGMFVFVVWDKKRKQLFAARDRLGIKPFYYSLRGDNLFFASEIKGILKISNIERKLNKQGFLDYLSYRQVLGDQTLFVGIKSLLPGHYFTYSQNREFKVRKYWDLPYKDAVKETDIDEKGAVEAARKLLEKAVHSEMVSDVPIGAFLSGGLDSSVLVALMSQFSPKPVKTFSLGFEEKGFSELEYAQLVSKYLKTDHQEFVLKGKDYLDLLPTVIKFKDGPLSTHNEIAIYVLSKELKKYITVVLSGDGADEIFAGYGRILRSGYDIERMIKAKQSGVFTARERKVLFQNFKLKYGDKIYSSVVKHFTDQYTYFPLAEKKKILNYKLFERTRRALLNENYFKIYFSEVSDLDFTDRYLNFFQKVHILGPVARLENSTMAASVEARVPYMDYKLVEFVYSLPYKYKMKWCIGQSRNKTHLLNSDQISEIYDSPKYILKEIGSKLVPAEVIKRKKMGFPVPLHSWFLKEFSGLAHDLLFSSDARSTELYNRKALAECLGNKNPKDEKQSGMNIWLLINIELWMRQSDTKI